MDYLELRKAFHAPDHDYAALYESRISDPHTIRIGLSVQGAPAFVAMVPKLYELVIQSTKLDKEIALLQEKLPHQAIEQYKDTLLINEIVITNEVEGVVSTRKEIGEILKKLEKNDRFGRFSGIVRKYKLLQDSQIIQLSSCEDIRNIYDELVLDEVVAAHPNNKPDGELFRAGPVHVVDQSGRAIHDGLEPEARITEALTASLAFLESAPAPLLVRLSTFHFLFGHIHPFYDGNGRVNRFISSYLLAREYEPICAFSLSQAVKENAGKYYKAFSTCQHKLNRGDLTPFALSFSEIVVEALASLRDSLAENEQRYRQFQESILPSIPPETRDVANALIIGTLFTHDGEGISAEDIASSLDISRQTLYKRMKPLKEMNLIDASKSGRQTLYHYATIDF